VGNKRKLSITSAIRQNVAVKPLVKSFKYRQMFKKQTNKLGTPK